MIVAKLIAVIVIAYLLGAIPFAYIVAKLVARIDITKYGSGNIGGTNVLRILGTRPAILVIILDLGKAVTAVLLTKVIFGEDVLLIGDFSLDWQIVQFIAAFTAMVGHNWSVFVKFRGGKGVAAYFGSWIAISLPTALFGGEILLLIAINTRYMSLGSMVGSLSVPCLLIPLTLVYQFPPIYLTYAILSAGLIIYQHRENITRLQTGTELKLGDGSHRLEL